MNHLVYANKTGQEDRYSMIILEKKRKILTYP